VPEEIATSWKAGWWGRIAVRGDPGKRGIVAVKAALAMTATKGVGGRLVFAVVFRM